MAAVNRHVTIELGTRYEEEHEMTTLVYSALFNFAENFPFKHQRALVRFRNSPKVLLVM
jgi:hypothetical protein